MKFSLIIFTLFLGSISFKVTNPSTEQCLASQNCRLSKVFLDSKLFKEYHYDNQKRLIRIDEWITDNGVGMFFTIKYDALERIETVMRCVTSIQRTWEKQEVLTPIYRYQKFVYLYHSKDTVPYYIEEYSGISEGHPDIKDSDFKKNKKGWNYEYDLRNRQLKKMSYESQKRNKKKKKKNHSWREFSYDTKGNPTSMDVIGYTDSLGISKYYSHEMRYDNSPNMQFKFFLYPLYPGIGNNNIIYEKSIEIDPRTGNETEIHYEYTYDLTYNNQGLVSEATRTTLTKSNPSPNEFGKYFFNYEYICDD